MEACKHPSQKHGSATSQRAVCKLLVLNRTIRCHEFHTTVYVKNEKLKWSAFLCLVFGFLPLRGGNALFAAWHILGFHRYVHYQPPVVSVDPAP